MSISDFIFFAEKSGLLVANGLKPKAFGDLPWNPSPGNEGVSLKHLLTGDETGGAISCHMVKVEPGGVILEHNHPEQNELHEVAAGSGLCKSAGGQIQYRPGVAAYIPKGSPHSVEAGGEGLLLLAKFTPALI